MWLPMGPRADPTLARPPPAVCFAIADDKQPAKCRSSVETCLRAQRSSRPSGALRSWHIVISNDPPFAFQTANLPDVLARKSQPDAGANAITLWNKEHAKVFQCAAHRLNLASGEKPSATAGLHPVQRFDRGRDRRSWALASPQRPGRSRLAGQCPCCRP
jgi:hypothetical protein